MKHNIYTNGNFQNIEFTDNDIDKSIGVVEPGIYNFETQREGIVECLTGELKINNVPCVPNGEKIIIKRWEKFTISAEKTSSYMCQYR